MVWINPTCWETLYSLGNAKRHVPRFDLVKSPTERNDWWEKFSHILQELEHIGSIIHIRTKRKIRKGTVRAVSRARKR